MIELTPTQWITKKTGVLQLSTNDHQSSGCLSRLWYFALFATMNRSRVLDEGVTPPSWSWRQWGILAEN